MAGLAPSGGRKRGSQGLGEGAARVPIATWGARLTWLRELRGAHDPCRATSGNPRSAVDDN